MRHTVNTCRDGNSRGIGKKSAGELIILFLCCAAAVLSIVSYAEGREARPLKVDEAVRLGLRRNALVRAATADAEAAEAVWRRVRAARLPALRTRAEYTRLSENVPGVDFTLPGIDTAITFQPVELNRLYSEISVELPLLSQVRLGHESRAARQEALSAELRAEQRRSDLAFEVRRAYWRLYLARRLRDLTGEAIEQVEAHLEEVRARRTEGAALLRDVLAAQTRRSEVMLELVEAENAVRVAELELNRLIGLPLDTPLHIMSEPDFDGISDADVDTTPGLADAAGLVPSEDEVMGRPGIGALMMQVRGLEERLDAERASLIPDLDLVGRYIYARPNPYFFLEQDDFRGSWEVLLSARWGIWEGGRRAAGRREARARLEAAEARLAEAREQVAVDVARLRLEVERAAEATGVAARNVIEAEETYRVALVQYEEGAALSTDILDAEEALRAAKARRAEALADLAIGRAAVLNALGEVW